MPHSPAPCTTNLSALAEAAVVLRWAGEEFGDDLVVTGSFGDATLVHLAHSVLPGVDIVLLDTGYLFAETEWFAEDLKRRYGLNLRTVHPLADTERNVWQTDTTACCNARKVEPLDRVLRKKQAWVTGLRRADSPDRASTPTVHADLLHGLTKINPLAAWTDAEIAAYGAHHDLPQHPLSDRGYSSIGCWPCTRPTDGNGDARSGRWAGSAKTECGLHLPPAGVTSGISSQGVSS